MIHVTDDQRRARLATRHALAPSSRVDSVEAATEAMTVLHATEPATVYLSSWARVNSVSIADVDRALYTDRTLVKQLAMRRTLFVFPRELLPAVLPSSSERVAAVERARLASDVEAVGLAANGDDWLDEARAAVLETLDAAPEGLTALELRKAVPMIDVTVKPPRGNPWSAPRLLIQLGVAGDIVRGTNTQHWRVSRPRLTRMRRWLGNEPVRLDAAAGYREIVRRYLYSFGPCTEADIVWWLGATKGIARAALASLDAVAVSLDGGDVGWLLPDDLADVALPGPWAALLPVLDPTPMGWQFRDFYLAPHSDSIFEYRGNAGTTAWVDGRVVGAWAQDAAGVVRVHILSDVTEAGRAALEREAERLTEWLGGERVGSIYVSPAMKDAAAL